MAPARTLLVTHRTRTTTFDLPDRGTLVIGRAERCDIFIDDTQVSRRHAAIHVEPGAIAIEDLGSHNGTFLIGVVATPADSNQTDNATDLRLTHHERVPLGPNALVRIGTAMIALRTRTARLTSQPGVPGFVVVDPAMQRVLEFAERAAATDLTVTLFGESGSGKEMVARFLHQHSPRAARRMIALNCAALPETLLESELFGHEKGAFSGAVATKPGLFEAADGGTLFLDEVGELPVALQAKLLRVLEDRVVLRVGALEPRVVNVRFIAATNRDLEDRIKIGAFREDLYYRLNGIALHVPPLRERREDIVPLAERFLAELDATRHATLTEAARSKLRAYDWPGNVRQLKNVLQRALVMSTGHELDVADLELRESRASAPTLDTEQPEELRQRAEEAERRKILDVLERCAGNQTRAAEMLGMTRRALVGRLEKFKLPRPRREKRAAARDDDAD